MNSRKNYLKQGFSRNSKLPRREIIFAEAESNKIGRLFIPLRCGKDERRFYYENQIEHRVKYILGEYDPHFLMEATSKPVVLL